MDEEQKWDEFIHHITHGLDWETAERALLRLHADLYLAQEESGYEFDALDLVGEIRNVLNEIREYADAARAGRENAIAGAVKNFDEVVGGSTNHGR